MSTPSLHSEILDACAGDDASVVDRLLVRWEEMVLKQAAGSGGVGVVQYLLEKTRPALPLVQKMLAAAAQNGNASVFRHLLQYDTNIQITDEVRSCALDGGVDIWKAILAHDPSLIKWDFGEKGDLLSMTAIANNVPLLSFFLNQGLDPNQSHFFSKPLLEVVTNNSMIKSEIVGLLVEHGATTEKSTRANRLWKNR